MASEANPRYRARPSSASRGEKASAGAVERNYRGRGEREITERRAVDKGDERLARESAAGVIRERGAERISRDADAATERSRERLPVENGDGGRRGRERDDEAAARQGRDKLSRENGAATGRRSAERDHGVGGRKREPEEIDRGRDGSAAGEDGGRGRVERDYGRAGRGRDAEPVDGGRGRFFSRGSRETGARARVDGDSGGRRGARDRDGMDTGRGGQRQCYSFRDPGRESSRDASRAGDSARHTGRGGQGGGDAGNGQTKDRARESQAVNRRSRDVLVRPERPWLPTLLSSSRRGQSGVGDRVSSSMSGKPGSSGSHSATFSLLHSSVSASSDHSLSVRRDSGRIDARSSAGAAALTQGVERLQQAREDVDDIEPGELPSGSPAADKRSLSPEDVVSQLEGSIEDSKEQGTELHDGAGPRDSPPKKRKFTPVVWDYVDKQDQPPPSLRRRTESGVGPSLISNSSSLHNSHLLKSPVQPPSVGAVEAQTPPRQTISPFSQPPSAGRVTPTSRGKRSNSPESLSSPSSPSSLSSPSSRSSLSLGEIRTSPAVIDVRMEEETIFRDTQDERTTPVDDDERMVVMQYDEDNSGPEPGEVLPTGEFSSRYESEQADDDDNGPEPGEVRADFESRQDAEDDDTVAVNISTSRWATQAETPDRGKSPLESKGQFSRLESKRSRTLSVANGSHGARGASKSPERKHDVNGRGSSSDSDKASHSTSVADEEYERRLNDRELMELDEEDSEGDEDEQRPEEDSDVDEAECKAPASPFRAIDMLQGCRSVNEFQMLCRIDEGTYGVVYQARDKRTGEVVALKKVKMETEKDGFPMTALREMNVLLSIHHPSVVNVKEVVVGSTIDSIYMVMEYMEHELKGLMETLKEPFSQSEVKCLMLQLLDGVNYLHGNWVLHRDLKTSNLLLNNRGELKICDFGLARQYGSPLQVYSQRVVTLWYRAPELLLGSKQYSTAIDMWSLGCIMAELMERKPLLDGKSEIEQINKIFSLLGTPSKEIWPDFVTLPGSKCNFVNQKYNMLRHRFPAASFGGKPTLSESGFELLKGLLTYDPKKRITAEAAMNHPWFREEPQAKAKEAMPSYPPRSKHDRKLRRLMKSPDPLDEQHRREVREGQQGPTSIFGIV